MLTAVFLMRSASECGMHVMQAAAYEATITQLKEQLQAGNVMNFKHALLQVSNPLYVLCSSVEASSSCLLVVPVPGCSASNHMTVVFSGTAEVLLMCLQ